MRGIPKSQKIWVTTKINDKLSFIITSNESRTTYNLYEISGESCEKIKTNSSPETFNKEIEKRGRNAK